MNAVALLNSQVITLEAESQAGAAAQEVTREQISSAAYITSQN